MSTENKNKLDELFKNGLNVPERHFDFSDADWDAMEHLLDKKKKRRVVYWLPYFSAAAAIVLVFLGWWFFKPVKPDNNNGSNIAIVKPGNKGKTQSGNPGNQVNTVNTPGADTSLTSPVGHPPQPAAATPQQLTRAEGGQLAQNTGANQQGIKQIKATNNGHKAGDIKNPLEQQVVKPDALADNAPKNNKPETIKPDVTQANANPVNKQAIAANDGSEQQSIETDAKPDYAAILQSLSGQLVSVMPVSGKNKKTAIKKTDETLSAHHGGPQLAITAWVSPDINGVSSFKGSLWGKNAGLALSVGISKKLTVSTGIAYSKKPYLTAYSNYISTYQFKTPPVNVTADCRVLDIPLNVDFKFLNRGKNAFSVGTGLSSYFMLKEKYTYEFAPGHAYGPTGFTVVNKNRHILGVLNLNTTYQRELTNKFSVGVQPYLKIPLTDIGNNRVRLQSAGVAVGVSWNINSKNP